MEHCFFVFFADKIGGGEHEMVWRKAIQEAVVRWC